MLSCLALGFILQLQVDPTTSASSPPPAEGLQALPELHQQVAQTWPEGIGRVLVEVSQTFLGAPYRRDTLETAGSERLVVNLESFDCHTLVESSLALARTFERGLIDPQAFRAELQAIRYRDGTIDGYSSRLHYVSDWITDNEDRGIVENITAALGGVPQTKEIHYMSSHRALYSGLAASGQLERVRAIEMELSRVPLTVVPKHLIRSIYPKLADGDIVAMTSTKRGLDIAHLGIVLRRGQAVHLLHASTHSGKVTISRRGLHEELARRRDRDGIMVFRPLQPQPGPNLAHDAAQVGPPLPPWYDHVEHPATPSQTDPDRRPRGDTRE